MICNLKGWNLNLNITKFGNLWHMQQQQLLFEPRGATAGARRFLRPGTRLLARRSRPAVYLVLEDRASRRTGAADRARARGRGPLCGGVFESF